jgi:hypothetical protein
MNYCNVEYKIILVINSAATVKTCGGSGGITLHILNLGSGWGEWSASRPTELEVRWAPDLICTLLRKGNALDPVGNRIAIPQSHSPYPNRYTDSNNIGIYNKIAKYQIICGIIRKNLEWGKKRKHPK